MLVPTANPALLYLPLLNDPSITVRRQASTILLTTYGEHAITLVRRLLAAPQQEIRQQARAALAHIADLTGLSVTLEPYTGMFITCLGHTSLFVDNQEVQLDAWVRREFAQVGWQKVLGVLGYLVHCGSRGTTRIALETAVWGKRPAPTVGRTLLVLRQLLSKLRDDSFAEQALVVADEHCLLRPEVYQTDVQAFDHAFRVAESTEEDQGLTLAAPLYAQALRLYGGPYLIDLPRGAPWAESRRDHLRGNFLIAAERVAADAYARQRYQECAAICGQIFDMDESADELVVLLLRSYMRLGRYSALEHAYRRYLAANTLDDRSVEGRQDTVVRAYEQLRTAKIS